MHFLQRYDIFRLRLSPLPACDREDAVSWLFGPQYPHHDLEREATAEAGSLRSPWDYPSSLEDRRKMLAPESKRATGSQGRPGVS